MMLPAHALLWAGSLLEGFWSGEGGKAGSEDWVLAVWQAACRVLDLETPFHFCFPGG